MDQLLHLFSPSDGYLYRVLYEGETRFCCLLLQMMITDGCVYGCSFHLLLFLLHTKCDYLFVRGREILKKISEGNQKYDIYFIPSQNIGVQTEEYSIHGKEE